MRSRACARVASNKFRIGARPISVAMHNSVAVFMIIWGIPDWLHVNIGLVLHLRYRWSRQVLLYSEIVQITVME